MRFAKNKTAAIAIAIFLMLSMTASMMLIPNANAHTPAWKIPTYAYINAAPNPVGVGQRVEVIMWLNLVIDSAAIGNDIRFHGYQLTITGPEGTNTVTFPVVNDTTSAQDYYFTPTKVGTYSLNFTFPGQKYTYTELIPSYYGPPAQSQYLNDTYLASSASTNLTVQQTPIASYPTTPLPTMYWTRPIYGLNTNWYTISSNWLGNGAPGYFGFLSSYNLGGNGEQLAGAGDLVGSLTSHIMWTKPLQQGGVVGGNQTAIEGDTYFEGSAYCQRYDNPIIVDGLLYYNEPISFSGVYEESPPNPIGPTDCVNLQTGQLVWSQQMPELSFAYIYDVQDPNQHGVYPPLLIATSGGFGYPLVWEAFDAFTGDALFNLTNVPSGTTILGPSGEQLIISSVNYGTPSAPNYYLQEWNSSKLWFNSQTAAISYYTPNNVPSILDGSNPLMLDWNFSVPYLNTAGIVTQVGAIYNDRLLCYSGNLPSMGADFMGPQSDTPYTYFTIGINPSTNLGTILWHQTYNPPPSNITVLEAGIDPVNRVFVEDYRETGQYVGYSLDTGQRIWGPTPPQVSLDYYGSPASGSLANAFAYGNMYSSAYGGVLYCYDTKNGNILWTYGNGGPGNSTNAGLETPFGDYPTFVNAIGNGVVYTVTAEHTIETPLFKGALARAINATTGKEIWTLSDYTGEFASFSYAMADGYNTWFNGYDNSIYVVGRGPSATTVTAPDIGVTTATPITITGTVMDFSAGTKQPEQAADFPYGVPCASDASMSAWMSYVYQQQPEPTNFTGVPVTLTETDVNHNTYVIGTTTTNAMGVYGFVWTPPILGNYTIVATFAGSLGYYGSSASTYIYASSPAPTAAPTASPPTGLATTSTVELGIVAIAIIIIIIGAVIVLLLLRKRP
jgi:hypothetical protein